MKPGPRVLSEKTAESRNSGSWNASGSRVVDTKAREGLGTILLANSKSLGDDVDLPT